MVFYVLLPAITFVKVTPAVTAPLLARWWPIAANVALSICGGLGLGALIALVTRTPAHLRRHVIVAAGVGNLHQLPLLLVSTACEDPGTLVSRALGAKCADQGYAYVGVGMAVASIFHQSVAYHLLKPRSEARPSAQGACVPAATGQMFLSARQRLWFPSRHRLLCAQAPFQILPVPTTMYDCVLPQMLHAAHKDAPAGCSRRHALHVMDSARA